MQISLDWGQSRLNWIIAESILSWYQILIKTSLLVQIVDLELKLSSGFKFSFPIGNLSLELIHNYSFWLETLENREVSENFENFNKWQPQQSISLEYSQLSLIWTLRRIWNLFELQKVRIIRVFTKTLYLFNFRK